jgi:hypothetical protein
VADDLIDSVIRNLRLTDSYRTLLYANPGRVRDAFSNQLGAIKQWSHGVSEDRGIDAGINAVIAHVTPRVGSQSSDQVLYDFSGETNIQGILLLAALRTMGHIADPRDARAQDWLDVAGDVTFLDCKDALTATGNSALDDAVGRVRDVITTALDRMQSPSRQDRVWLLVMPGPRDIVGLCREESFVSPSVFAIAPSRLRVFGTVVQIVRDRTVVVLPICVWFADGDYQ